MANATDWESNLVVAGLKCNPNPMLKTPAHACFEHPGWFRSHAMPQGVEPLLAERQQYALAAAALVP